MSSSSSLDAPDDALSPLELFGWPLELPVALFARLHLKRKFICQHHCIDTSGLLLFHFPVWIVTTKPMEIEASELEYFSSTIHDGEASEIHNSALTLPSGSGTRSWPADRSDSAPWPTSAYLPATDIYDSRISAPSSGFVGAWNGPVRPFSSIRTAALNSSSRDGRTATFSMKTLEWQDKNKNIPWFIIEHESIVELLSFSHTGWVKCTSSS